MIGNAAARLAVTAAVVFMTSSEAFVPTGAPIVARRSAIYDESSVRSGVMLPNQRRSNDVCMSLEGDSTRGMRRSINCMESCRVGLVR